MCLDKVVLSLTLRKRSTLFARPFAKSSEHIDPSTGAIDWSSPTVGVYSFLEDPERKGFVKSIKHRDGPVARVPEEIAIKMTYEVHANYSDYRAHVKQGLLFLQLATMLAEFEQVKDWCSFDSFKHDAHSMDLKAARDQEMADAPVIVTAPSVLPKPKKKGLGCQRVLLGRR